MNRGFKWSGVVDTEKSYSISVRMGHPDVKCPVTADMTIRNAQRFKPRAGQALWVVVGQEPPRRVAADRNGFVTVPGISFSSAAPLRIDIE